MSGTCSIFPQVKQQLGNDTVAFLPTAPGAAPPAGLAFEE